MTRPGPTSSPLVLPEGSGAQRQTLPDTLKDPKVKPRHLTQRAFIYVRQSSPTRAKAISANSATLWYSPVPTT